MFKRFSLFFLLTGAMCAAQTVAPGATQEDQTQTVQPDVVQPSTDESNEENELPPTGTPTVAPTVTRRAARAEASELESRGTSQKQVSRRPNVQAIKSDFELFAADAAGHPVPIFCRNLFEQTPSTFAPVDHVPVPADYVIGPGDELLIRVWGMVDFQVRLFVDRNGQVSLPKVGVLTVSGLRYSELDGFLRAAIGRVMKGFELNVTLGQLRSIQVFILGNVRQPGVYTVSSLSTLVNALFDSGGPSATGTMRNIQLRRADHVITEFDVYDLQQKGDKSHDVQLLPGDVIFFPPVGEQVAVIGNVNRPAIYELKGKTTVSDALRGAGGLSEVASVDLAVLERIEDHSLRHVDQFALNDENFHRELHGGDILRVFPISPKFDNAVTLRGNVATPHRFPWHAGMRVSDLIPNRDFLVTRTHWDQQNQLSDNPRPDLLANIDRNNTGQNNTDQNSTDQNNPDQYNPDQNNPDQNNPDRNRIDRNNLVTGTHWDRQSRVADNAHIDMLASIDKNSAEINWDYASIERLDMRDLSTRLIPFNLGQAVDTPTSAENQELQAGDVVTIFSRKDLAVPMEKHVFFVRVGGEVNVPGVYRVKPGDSLRNIILEAGGFTSHSYVYGTLLTRKSAKEIQQQQLNQSILRMRRDLVARYASNRQAIAPGDNSSTKMSDQLSIEQNLIDQLSAVQPTGRIILDLKTNARTLEDLPDLMLEDGDTIQVPARLGTVQVVGEVYNENAFRYEPRKTVEAYLREAGGATRDADVTHTYVLHADGTMINRHSDNHLWKTTFAKTTLMPGDAIVVPFRIKTPSTFWQNLAPITSVLSQTATTGVILGSYIP